MRLIAPVAWALAAALFWCGAASAEDRARLLVIIDQNSLDPGECQSVSAAVGRLARAVRVETEVLLAWGGTVVRPTATVAAVRASLCDAPQSRQSPEAISPVEAFEILRRNEAVRDSVIRRICGSTPPSGCGGRVGAEAQSIARDLHDRSEAFLAVLDRSIRATDFEGLVLVSAGPPTGTVSSRIRKQLRDAVRRGRVRTAILAVRPPKATALAAVQSRSLSVLRDVLDASLAPLGDDRAEVRAIRDRFADLLGADGTSDSPGGRHGRASPSTLEIVSLAAAHVSEFARQAAVVLAIEHYDQAIKSRAGSFGLSGTTRMGIIRQRRSLRSEVALVQVLDGSLWMIARDVLSVDGRLVGERPSLAASIPTDTVENALRYLHSVAEAGARFNVGDIRRNLNTPTLALMVLLDSFRHRFVFHDEGTDQHGATTLGFEERTDGPTLFQVNSSSAPATGRLWIDARTGAVRRTELVLESSPRATSRATVTVDYEQVPEVGAWMPVKMTEKYEEPGKRESDWIECTATYSQFRRFTVTTKIR